MASLPGEFFDDNFDVGYLDWEEAEHAKELFEAGWGHHHDEPGYDPDIVHNAREEFWEFTGMDYDEFPWDEWREAMGYE